MGTLSSIDDKRKRASFPQPNAESIIMEELNAPWQHIAAGGDGKLDDLMKVLLEKMDKDAREREERYHRDAQEREKRYREEMMEQDRRFRQEAKDREERILTSIGELKRDIRSEFAEIKEDTRTSRNTLVALSVATILGVAAMVVGALIALFNQ